MNELEGFVLFAPERNTYSGVNMIGISITKTGCRFTAEALDIMGSPNRVVIFFDSRTKRMMVKPAKDGLPNTLRLSKQGKYRNTLTQACFLTEIETVCGKKFEGSRMFFAGHKADCVQPTLIFDLKTDLDERTTK